MLSNKFTIHTEEVCKQLAAASKTYTQWRIMLDALGMTELSRECERVEDSLDSAINEAKYLRGQVAAKAKRLSGESDD